MIQPRVLTKLRETRRLWCDNFFAKIDEENDFFMGHIPTIDPYTAEVGQKVVFNSANTWTLVHKKRLTCETCRPEKDYWFWVVRYTRLGGHGETQVWSCHDERFWKKVWDRRYEQDIKDAIEQKNQFSRECCGLATDYIIYKRSRWYKGGEGYGGSTCGRAGVSPSKRYTTYKEAEADASKLTEHNLVGFDIVHYREKE